MCSIFGFIARKQDRAIDLKVIASIVEANITRGPHAYGFSWIDPHGTLHCYKQKGRLTDHLGALSMARNARVFIGHLRYATHGSPELNQNNHPHPCDGGWMVHNGIVRNYDRLVRDNRLWPVSECDSEAITQLVEQEQGARLKRCTSAVDQTAGDCTVLGLWPRPNTLIAIRRGNPLHISRTPTGIYLASLARGLPGEAKIIRDGSGIQLRLRDGQILTRRIDFDKKQQKESDLFTMEQRRGGEYRGG